MNRISKHSMEAMPEDTPTILLFRRTARPIRSLAMFVRGARCYAMEGSGIEGEMFDEVGL